MTIAVNILNSSGSVYTTINVPSLNILYSELCIILSDALANVNNNYRIFNYKIFNNIVSIYPPNIMINDNENIIIENDLNILFVSDSQYENLVVITPNTGTIQVNTFRELEPRNMIHFVINMLNIQITDLCYDPAFVRGSFIFGFAHKYKDNANFIKNNIHGCEFNKQNYNDTIMNITHNNLDDCLPNIMLKDSLNDNHQDLTKNKYDVIAISIFRNNISMYIKHIYNSLKQGGRCAVIIPRVFLTSNENRITKYFLKNNCTITHLIDIVPSINKEYPMLIMLFTKGGKTTEAIEFGLLNNNEYITKTGLYFRFDRLNYITNNILEL